MIGACQLRDGRAGMRIAFQGSDRAQLAEFILQKVA
jgi:hypothetical protein